MFIFFWWGGGDIFIRGKCFVGNPKSRRERERVCVCVCACACVRVWYIGRYTCQCVHYVKKSVLYMKETSCIQVFGFTFFCAYAICVVVVFLNHM